jgi:hypothetical protein
MLDKVGRSKIDVTRRNLRAPQNHIVYLPTPALLIHAELRDWSCLVALRASARDNILTRPIWKRSGLLCSHG